MGKDSKSSDKRQYTIVALSIALIILTIVPSVSAATDIGFKTIGTTIYPAKTITVSGSVPIDTAITKFGGGSASFTGTNGQYIRISDSSSFNFGSSDFTIEMWVRYTSTPPDQDLYTKRASSSVAISVTLLISGGKLMLAGDLSSSNGWEISQVASVAMPTTGAWVHVALVRSGSTWTVYQNGVAVITYSKSGTLTGDNSLAQIGGATDKYSMTGHVDEVRISNIARYTAPFDPSKTLTQRFDHDANTLVLLHLDGGFQDDVITGQATATKITVPSDNTPIASMSFYTHASGSYRLAIYDSSNTKLWESPDSVAPAIAGWNTITIAAGSPSSLTLNAGTYWLVYQWNSGNSGPSYTAGISGDGKYYPMSYSPFPGSLTGTTSDQKYSIYITTGGLIVTPENNYGAVVAVATCLGGFGVFVGYKKKSKN